MRFLLGILAGATAALVLAQVWRTAPGDWGERVLARADRATTALVALARQADSGAAPTSGVAPAGDPAGERPVDSPVGLAPSRVDEPAAAGANEGREARGDVAADQAAEAPLPAAVPIPRPVDPHTGAAQPGSQAVWAPFHSEMSANGFAERLTSSLDHPFTVAREGPGRYQVSFRYRDERQRRTLLARAAEVTGLPL
jgi:hypothetical protein